MSSCEFSMSVHWVRSSPLLLVWLLSALRILQEPPLCSLLRLLLGFRPWLLTVLSSVSTAQRARMLGLFPHFSSDFDPCCALSCPGAFLFPPFLPCHAIIGGLTAWPGLASHSSSSQVLRLQVCMILSSPAVPAVSKTSPHCFQDMALSELSP